MKKLLCLLLPLAGCATEPTYQEIAGAMRQAPSFEVCYLAVAGKPNVRAVAADELRGRGSNCQDEMPLVMARLQNDQAKRAAAMAFFQAQQRANIATQQNNARLYQSAMPQPTTTPQNGAPVICSSQVVGGQLQTICQ